MKNWFRKKSKKNRKEMPNNAMIFNRTLTGTSPLDGKYIEYNQNHEPTFSKINNTTAL